jgi:type II secretory pathway pseudopilin PulG
MTLPEVVIALAIASLTVAGIVSGYIYCMNSAVRTELMEAAHAQALQRLEQTRSAVWAPNRAVPEDQLVSSNFPDLQVTLDLPGTNGGTTAIIKTTIASISDNPPMRKIHVDAIWNFQGSDVITNSIETIRAPDQ